MRRHLPPLLAVALAAAAAYLPCLRGEFQFDDAMGLERGGWLLRSPTTGGKLGELADVLVRDWKGRGLVTCTYRINYWMMGAKQRTFAINAGDTRGITGPFHVFNVVLHVACAAGLYAILAWMALRIPGASPWRLPLAGASWFALHPLCAETAAYISARTGSMAAAASFAGIAGFLFLGLPGPDGAPRPARRRAAAAGILLAGTFVAVGCKETGWMTPPLAFVLMLWGYPSMKTLLRDWGWALLGGAAAFALAMAYFLVARGMLTGAFLGQYAEAYRLRNPDALFSHAATQMHAWIGIHLPRALFPFGFWHPNIDLDPHVFRIDLDGTEGDGPGWMRLALAEAALLPALAFALWRFSRRRSPWAAALAWIALAALPVSFAPLQDATTERHTYMPLAGLALGLAPVLDRLLRPRAGRAAAMAAGACLFAITFGRACEWRTEVGLWMAATRDAPQKPRPYYNTAKSMLRISRDMAADDPAGARALGSRAKRILRLTLRLSPGFHLARGALGRELDRQGHREEAVEEYRLAVRLHLDRFLHGEAETLHAPQASILAAACAKCLAGLGRLDEGELEIRRVQDWFLGYLRERGASVLVCQQLFLLIRAQAALLFEHGRPGQARETLHEWKRLLGWRQIDEIEATLTSASTDRPAERPTESR